MEIIHDGRRYMGVDPAGAADLGIPPEVVAAAQLADARARALRDIDVAAAAARGRHATTAAGQDGVYQIKADQAQAWMAAGQPEDASPWALLTVEAAARGMTVPALVAEIIATRDAWIAILAQIEGARMAGKDAVRAASSVAAITGAAGVALATLRGI
ncbi:hypothetical protein [Tistrella mobilis]